MLLCPRERAQASKPRLKACCSFPARSCSLVLHFPLVSAENTVFPLCLLATQAESLALLQSVPPGPGDGDLCTLSLIFSFLRVAGIIEYFPLPFFLLRCEPCFCAPNLACGNSGQLVYHMAEVTRRSCPAI